MNELALFMNSKRNGFKCSVFQCPTGKFSFCGSVPETLGKWVENKMGQKIFRPNVYETEKEALEALEGTK